MRIKLNPKEQKMIKRLLKRLKNDLGITNNELANILNVSINELKHLNLDPQAYYKIGTLDALIYRGKKVLGAHKFKKWLRSKPPIFKGSTPLDYLTKPWGDKIILHSLSVINGDSCA